jgi:hypothetical protein
MFAMLQFQTKWNILGHKSSNEMYHPFNPINMKKSIFLSGSLLVMLASSAIANSPMPSTEPTTTPTSSPSAAPTAPAETTTPETSRPGTIVFECRVPLVANATPSVITIEPNKKYSVAGATPPGGNYTKVGNTTYRFKSGPLKKQSIVFQSENFILVETKSEAKAAELAAADGAQYCTKK